MELVSLDRFEWMLRIPRRRCLAVCTAARVLRLGVDPGGWNDPSIAGIKQPLAATIQFSFLIGDPMMHATPAATGDAWRPIFERRTIFALSVTIIATVSIFAWIVYHGSMMGAIWLSFLFLVSWGAFIVILARASACNSGLRVLFVIPTTFVFVFALFFLEGDLLYELEYMYPPLRPMFHNRFVERERAWLPFWVGPTSFRDDAGNAIWVDYETNMAVIVIGAAVDGSWSGPRPDPYESQFTVGPSSTELTVTVRREVNRLVVIRQDGEVANLRLPPNVVREFVESGPIRRPDLMADFRLFLDEENRSRLDSFVSTNRAIADWVARPDQREGRGRRRSVSLPHDRTRADLFR